jgi:cytochrome c oxidase assembly factor CtaG
MGECEQRAQARVSGCHTDRVGTSRTPGRLMVAAWLSAFLVLALLALAVIKHLSGTGTASMPMSHALFRAGGSPLDHPLLGSALVTSWQLDPVAIAVLVLLAAAYLTAVALVPIRQAGERWPLLPTLSFMAGLLVCGLATNASIAVYDQVLFSAHMLGHLALVMAAPALLVAGQPLTLAVRSSAHPDRVRRRLRGRVLSLLTAPPVALASYTVVIVGSHLTGVMDTIMRITWMGQLEHLVYLLAGLQFFVLVIGDEPIRWRLTTPPRWLMLAIAMAVDTFTGIVLLQSTSPVHMLSAPGLDVDALSDTRTGGAIMWVGGDAIMAIVMVTLVVGWLRRPELRADDQRGWAEQARRATFTENTGVAATATADGRSDFDDDDQARSAYNDWLNDLSRRS